MISTQVGLFCLEWSTTCSLREIDAKSFSTISTYRQEYKRHSVRLERIAKLSCDKHPFPNIALMWMNPIQKDFKSNEHPRERPICPVEFQQILQLPADCIWGCLCHRKWDYRLVRFYPTALLITTPYDLCKPPRKFVKGKVVQISWNLTKCIVVVIC